MKTVAWCLFWLLLLACGGAMQTAADVTVRVADDVCQAEAKQPTDPEWVALACQAESAASQIVHLLLPAAAAQQGAPNAVAAAMAKKSPAPATDSADGG